jgi:RNA polymerase sigma-70 factor, ECF subfamily
MHDDEQLSRTYADLRPLLFSIAYRMLGSVSDAEDIVQESFVRYRKSLHTGTAVDSPRAYLATIATRLSLDLLKSARAQRETYVGTWLPEPLLADPAPDVAEQAELADSLSMAFLVLLETLSPTERAVFLLRDVFGYDFDEIAAIIDKRPDNCRQLLTRARKHIEQRRPRFEPSREHRQELAGRFFAACRAGDLAGLESLLAADVTFTGDGGGLAPAAARVVNGVEKVARLLMSLATQAAEAGVITVPGEVNGQPGVTFTTSDGLIISVLCLDIADGRVQAVRGVVNPEKLRHVGPVADLRGMMRSARGRPSAN